MLAVTRGHGEVVRVLIGAGAAVELQGTGAPGFAGRTAHDLAAARGDAGTLALLPLLAPLSPRDAAQSGAAVPVAGDLGRGRRAGRLHAADSRRHPRPPAARLAGARPRSPPPRICPSPPDPRGALRRRRGVAGAAGRLHVQAPRAGGALWPGAVPIVVRGHAGQAYPLGPEVPPDDIDGRSASVVTWADGPMFYFVMSTQLESRRRGAGGRVALRRLQIATAPGDQLPEDPAEIAPLSSANSRPGGACSGPNPSGHDLRLAIRLAEHRRAGHAAQQRQLADVGEGVGDRRLEQPLERVPAPACRPAPRGRGNPARCRSAPLRPPTVPGSAMVKVSSSPSQKRQAHSSRSPTWASSTRGVFFTPGGQKSPKPSGASRSALPPR